MVSAKRIFETCLYAGDLAESERFYVEVLGLERIARAGVLVAFRCGDGVLILFDRKKASAPGRSVPSHGAEGAGHLAFGAAEDELPAWRERLRDHGIAIEAETDWPEGGRSIYFRDPAGNLLEIAPPTLWGSGWGF